MTSDHVVHFSPTHWLLVNSHPVLEDVDIFEDRPVDISPIL